MRQFSAKTCLLTSCMICAIAASSSFCGIANAQTAAPAQLPNMPTVQTQNDQNGIDRASGNPTIFNYESVNIGNKFSSLSASYGPSGVSSLVTYIELERVSIYGGGFIVARVNGGGEVHVFQLGSISQYTYQYGPASHPAWNYTASGTATNTSQTDTFTDVSGDGAILTCSGPSAWMYTGGTCSLYLENSGVRIDYKMPSVRYDLHLEARCPVNTSGEVAYMWPIRMIRSDGEVLTYNYINYGEYDSQSGAVPAETKWNSLDSSLGYRIYLSSDTSYYLTTPTGTSNPGTFYPGALPNPGGALYAINTSKEYADPLTVARSFGSSAQSSIRAIAPSGQSWDLFDNGVKMITQTLTGSALIIAKPGGGVITYNGVTSFAPYTTIANGKIATPANSFPFRNFSISKNGTTSYSVAVDASFPEIYTETITAPDGGIEKYTIQYGNIHSYRDPLGRITRYGYVNEQGYYSGIPRFASDSKISGITLPSGLLTLYQYTRGALSGVVVNPSDGGAALITVASLASSCSVATYRICNKPIYVKDANGNQTDYTYDAAHGGVLTETFPADSNGIRPQKRYSYAQLYPKILNSSGALVNSSAVWRLVRVSECLTATAINPASCVGTATEKVTTYSYNDNNLYLTSETAAGRDGSNSTAVYYTYNYVGDVTSVRGAAYGH